MLAIYSSDLMSHMLSNLTSLEERSKEGSKAWQAEQTRQDSTVEMQVLCLGLPRCATTSITAILESDIIDIKPTIHGSVTAGHNNKSVLLLDALRLKGGENVVSRRAKLRELLDGYAACLDSLNALADDLMDIYPNAKLILNVRPPPRRDDISPAVAWAKSCNDTIGFFAWFVGLAACWPLRRYRFWWCRYRLNTELWRYKQLLPSKGSSLLSPKGCEWMTPDFYDRYITWIQGEAKKRDRDMLLWHPGMGWQPLCEFLGKKSPPTGTPLPCLNDESTIKMHRRTYWKRGLLHNAMYMTLIGAFLRSARRMSGKA